MKKIKKSLPSILSLEDKKYLRSYTRYFRALGMKDGLIEIDVEEYDINDIDFSEIKSFSNNFKIEVTEELQEIFSKIFNFIYEKGLYDDNPDVDDINYRRVEIEIDTITETISVSDFYTYYDTSDTRVLVYDDEEEIEPLFGAVIEMANNENIRDSIFTLKFYGSGDSGYIESNFENNLSVPTNVEDWCYQQLSNNYGGWEINEGSQGEFVFDLNSREITLNFIENVEQNVTNTIFEEEFSN
jgi:hypothetical protein